jgi:putative chitinase
MNKPAFYAALRKSKAVFGTSLSQAQVDVLNAILDQCKGMPAPHVAYIMATAYHETGTPRMVPSVESLHYTTAARIRAVWPSRFQTEASAAPFVRNARKLANHVYNGRLGNRAGSDDGWTYRGRGLDHLTGRDNYTRAVRIVGADVLDDPDLMLVPDIAVRSIVHGMTTGRYRGKRLSDYDIGAGFDYVNARAIINADVRANGELVAGYARAFRAALQEADWGVREVYPPVRVIASLPDNPSPAPSGGFWAELVKAILGIIRGRG